MKGEHNTETRHVFIYLLIFSFILALLPSLMIFAYRSGYKDCAFLLHVRASAVKEKWGKEEGEDRRVDSTVRSCWLLKGVGNL